MYRIYRLRVVEEARRAERAELAERQQDVKRLEQDLVDAHQVVEAGEALLLTTYLVPPSFYQSFPVLCSTTSQFYRIVIQKILSLGAALTTRNPRLPWKQP